MQELKMIRGLVLDLRFNRGQELLGAAQIAEMFIDDGLIVTVRDRVGREEPYTAISAPLRKVSYLEFPMVCLVNGYTTSASEIVAACLQDHKRALIVGERTTGKGTLQLVQPFEEGDLKLSIATLWRPSGKNLNRFGAAGQENDQWGVSPDKGYLVKLSYEERAKLLEYQQRQEIIPGRNRQAKQEESQFQDGQLEKALQYVRDQIKLAERR